MSIIKYIILVIVFILGSLLAELLLSHYSEHAIFLWHKMPGFELVYGFIGCIVIIIVSKLIGQIWLQKKEDYYPEDKT